MANTCEIPDGIKEVFKKFKLANKHNAALIFNINKAKLEVELEKEVENCSLEEIAQDLPETAPRYITYSYKHIHTDGRVSFPLVFIFYCPSDINPSAAMLYSSTKTRLVNAIQVMKIFDVQDSSILTEQWLIEKLKFFK